MIIEITIYQYEKHIFTDNSSYLLQITDNYPVPHVNTKPGI